MGVKRGQDRLIRIFINSVRDAVRREEFHPSWRGIFVNPAFLIRRELARNVQRCAASAVHAGDNVLDYGCGSKPYEEYFRDAHSYTGVDVEATGHDHATSDVDVFFDGLKLPFPDRQFDLVVAFEVLEHVETTLFEIRRVTKQDGRLLVTTPFVWPEHEEPFDFRRLTSYGLEAILVESGYTDVTVTKVGSEVLAITQLVINYLSRVTTPANPFTFLLFMAFIGAPLNLLGIILDAILPNVGQLYLCNVATARVSASPAVAPTDSRQ